MIILTGNWHPEAVKEVYKDFRIRLLQSLPMNDILFLELLNKQNLFPGDLQAQTQAKDTPAEKAAWFLNNAIEPSLNVDKFEPLQKLLITMGNEKDFKSDLLKQLSADMREKLDKVTSLVINSETG